MSSGQNMSSGKTFPDPVQRQPLAEWDPVTDRWITAQPDLFSGRSAAYSGIWPPSGMMRNGEAFERPTSVPVTEEKGCSSWLGTPTANDPGITEHNLKRHYLSSELVAVMPTPTATPYGSNRSDSPYAARRPSIAGVVKELPTPMANEAEKDAFKPRNDGHQQYLSNALAELPTPRVSDMNGAWLGRPSGGQDLRTTVALLPTTISSQRDYTPEQGVERMARKTGHNLGELATGDYFGKYGAAVARQTEAFGVAPPPPTEIGPKGNPRLNAAFAEWMMGLEPGWITEVPGMKRSEAIELAGNGVVPQQAEHALRMMLDAKVKG